MNLNPLYPVQAELDEYIGRTKGIDMSQYKKDRIIAFSVEFHELLNELIFLFKYWKNAHMDREKALEEYVDGMHFLVSIGNDFGITEHSYVRPNEQDMKQIALGIMNMISILPNIPNFKPMYNALANYYILFGEKLGFFEEEITNAYMKKHEENYARQMEGY